MGFEKHNYVESYFYMKDKYKTETGKGKKKKKEGVGVGDKKFDHNKERRYDIK